MTHLSKTSNHMSSTAPYLVATSNTTTPSSSSSSSPTSCNLLMCANVVSMFLHSAHFGWVRSAGSRGLVTFEEVVALHGVPSYIEVKGSDAHDDNDDVTPPQPIPLRVQRKHNLSGATIVLSCNNYGDLSDKKFDQNTLPLRDAEVSDFGVNGGSTTHICIRRRKVWHIRFIAGTSITEVGDEEIAVGDGGDETEMWARSIELVGFENVINVRDTMFYNYKHITSIDLSPLSNVTSIGSLFLSKCDRLKSIDLSALTKLTRIGDDFMTLCKSLTSINFKGLIHLSKIEDFFMSSCEYLDDIDLSPLVGLTHMGKGFLLRCRNLKSVLLPNATGLTTIPSAFLCEARALTSIDLQPLAHVTSIGARFLSRCKRLTSLDLTPLSNVTFISRGFLEDCRSLSLMGSRDSLSVVLQGALPDDDEDSLT